MRTTTKCWRTMVRNFRAHLLSCRSTSAHRFVNSFAIFCKTLRNWDGPEKNEIGCILYILVGYVNEEQVENFEKTMLYLLTLSELDTHQILEIWNNISCADFPFRSQDLITHIRWFRSVSVRFLELSLVGVEGETHVVTVGLNGTFLALFLISYWKFCSH